MAMLDWTGTLDGWASLAMLSSLEVLLSIDNIVAMALIVARFPRATARQVLFIGLLFALGLRLLVLWGIAGVYNLTSADLSAFGHAFSWRDVMLLTGGVLLIAKGVYELHIQVEGRGEAETEPLMLPGIAGAIIQIAVVNLIFSLDSIITAFGVTRDFWVMAIGVCIGVVAMFLASDAIADFIDRHPAVKTLALAFLIVVGVALCAEAVSAPVPRSVIFIAMIVAALITLASQVVLKNRKRARKPARPKILASR
jgi:predicted tellurium resistance membrane protein TerC